MKNNIWLFVVISFLFIVGGTADAQWERVYGCMTTDPTSVVVKEGYLFVSTAYNGVFRSTNLGTTWQAINEGLPELHIHELVSTNIGLLAGTSANGVFLSTNNGSSWTAINNGLTTLNVRAFAVVGTKIFTGTWGGGVFLSTNNGANWEPVNNGITNWKIQSFAVKDTCLFVGTQSDGVFYSTNYGKNWTAKNAGLLNKDIRDAIVIDDVVLVITNGWGVHRSTDNGDNWSYVDINPRPYYVSSFYKKGDTLYFGAMDCLFSSVNKGISWEYLTMAFGNSHTFVVTDSCVITGSEWGVWSGVYSQGDYSWKSLTNYITDDYIKSVFISDDIIYAGKFRSDDNGANFKEIKEFGEVASYLADGSNIFAGLSNSGVQISTDYGVNWEEINNGLTRTDITCLEMMGQDIFAGTFGGVFRSTNNGGSWTGVNTGLSGIKITSLASTSTAIFAGTIGGGINISTNNGMNWATSNSGLTNANINDFVVNELNIYAGTDNGLFFSQNNGVSWQKINSQLFTDTKINTLFTFNSRIYAGVKNGLYMSSDFGDAWYKIDTGLPNTSVLSIGIKGGYIYVGTLDNGLWKCLLSEIIVSVNEESINQANNFRLSQNYPNPFNPSTTISFSLPKKEFVTLKIYDVLGKEITTLVNEELNAGSYKNDWNAGNLASGIYFYRLQAGKYNETRKIMLLK